MAECLFLRSAATDRLSADWKRAVELAQKTLIEDFGINSHQFIIADGSGLSRQNKVTPTVLTSLLYRLRREKIFTRSLSIAGVDGTLRRRFRNSRCKGRIIAKTGSLNRVSALSGYVMDKKGNPSIAFSIIVNGSTRGKNYNAKVLQKEICELLLRAVDRKELLSSASTPQMLRTGR